jgi:hypothetical protein
MATGPLPKRFALRTLGKLTFAPSDPVRPLGQYVYQRVRPGLGNVAHDRKAALQLRRHTEHQDAHTPAQLEWRERFTAAVTAWHALDPAARHAWQIEGKKKRLPGYNAFLSAALRQ